MAANELITTSFDFSRANVGEDVALLVVTFVLLFVTDAAFKRAGWFPKDANGRYLVSGMYLFIAKQYLCLPSYD